MKRLILMGASGSIGTQAIDVINQHRDELELVGVSVGKKTDYLRQILDTFKIKYAYSLEPDHELIAAYPDTKFFWGDDGLVTMARLQDYDMLVNALVGFVGFKPTLEAIKNHKNIALANKETLVAGGKIINEALAEYGVELYPIDSEHVAIWQCMQGHQKGDIRRLIITASGGAFRGYSRDELVDATLDQALNHPVWNMGAKITIDSATMMNKGFEVIEAHYLFDIPYDKIDVILHKEATVHSMVEYNDGSIIAQLGCPDMRLMIKYALLYPDHKWDKVSQYLDFDKITSLNFMKMDYSRYPLVKLAKQVGSFEGNFGAVLIGANDEAVALFMKDKIKFVDIEAYIFKTLKAAHFIKNPTADQIIESHQWAKEYVDKIWANE
ncbi:MAG: 1-deoxy-D-xylulose-5-phosphate reductoisomerase [Erysipelotrichaceae bacterium]|nr:1-deoxy-D-xylulose-5-phosphate reductoisomerase [Erysipelotrichaceae bacterium]MBP5280255.1 1-deoxy-D-xylulose-5-phosphate reductoisomerase [Erysipelotrichaceae bacterium]